MTRAEKRRAYREAQKAAKKPNGILQPQTITLSNPVSDHFPNFIYANSLVCEKVAVQGSGRGKSLVICGAGPSLADDAASYCYDTDELWAVNSALPWLFDNGFKPTHAITVDQTAHMVEEWYSAPDVEYLLASTCHPHLVEYLMEKQRSITFFHNFVGIKQAPVQLENGEIVHYEDWLYSTLFETTVRVGAGLNSVTRAIDLACFMGFKSIKVLGADCALRTTANCPTTKHGSPEHLRWLKEHTIMHADGGHALASNATPLTLGGDIDGRHWETKPDLIISAVWLARMQNEIPRLELIGDTLPNALKDKTDDFLDQLPTLTDSNGEILRYDAKLNTGYDDMN